MKEPPLPMGWKECSPPDDPTDAGTPEDERTTTARVRFARKCLRFWHRGGRCVRLCEELEPDRSGVFHFALHTGSMNREGEDYIKFRSFVESKKESREERLADMVTEATELMAMGGY